MAERQSQLESSARDVTADSSEGNSVREHDSVNPGDEHWVEQLFPPAFALTVEEILEDIGLTVLFDVLKRCGFILI